MQRKMIHSLHLINCRNVHFRHAFVAFIYSVLQRIPSTFYQCVWKSNLWPLEEFEQIFQVLQYWYKIYDWEYGNTNNLGFDFFIPNHLSHYTSRRCGEMRSAWNSFQLCHEEQMMFRINCLNHWPDWIYSFFTDWIDLFMFVWANHLLHQRKQEMTK